MNLLHTRNYPGNLHDVAHHLNRAGWAEKVVSMHNSGFTTVVVLLLDSDELLKIRSQPHYDFSEKGGPAYDFPVVPETITNLSRLLKFCAIQDIHLRDNCDNCDPIYEAWRQLPEPLQAAINHVAEKIDEKNSKVTPNYCFSDFVADLQASDWEPNYYSDSIEDHKALKDLYLRIMERFS